MKNNNIKKIIKKKQHIKFLAIVLLCLFAVGGLAHTLGVYSFANEMAQMIDGDASSEMNNQEDTASDDLESTDPGTNEDQDDLESDGTDDEELTTDEDQLPGDNDTETAPESTVPTYIEASFSFDGSNANELMLLEAYRGYELEWEYTLDNHTWSTATSDTVVLTSDEIERINPIDDIRVCVVGNNTESEIYTIDILEGVEPDSIYGNDRENLLFGYDAETMEYRLDEDDTWEGKVIADALLEGEGILHIRNRAKGVTVTSESIKVTFTTEDYPTGRSYVPLKYQSINDYSGVESNNDSKLVNNTENLLDGNANTFWYQKVEGASDEKYLVIDIQIPIFLSALEYIPRQDNNAYGIIQDLQIEVSLDGVEWTTIVEGTDWALDSTTKELEIDPSKRQMAKYIRFVSNKSINNDDISASMFNLFEDLSLLENPKAELEYSTTDWTNEDVTVTVVGQYEPIIVVNNNASYSYTFTENDVFIFEIENLRGMTSQIVASVNNIDKIAPTADVTYSRFGITIIATLANASEDITVDGYSSYTFVKNGTYTFKYVDRAGNVGQTTAVVDSIGVTTDTPIIPEVDNSGSSDSSNGSTTTTPDITLNIPSTTLLPTVLGTSSSNTSDSEAALEGLLTQVEVYEEDENLETSLGTLVGNANREELSDSLEVVEIEKTEELDVLLLCVQSATILSFLFISYKYYKTRKNNKGRSH